MTEEEEEQLKEVRKETDQLEREKCGWCYTQSGAKVNYDASYRCIAPSIPRVVPRQTTMQVGLGDAGKPMGLGNYARCDVCTKLEEYREPGVGLGVVGQGKSSLGTAANGRGSPAHRHIVLSGCSHDVMKGSSQGAVMQP